MTNSRRTFERTIDYVLDLIATVERVPAKYLKHLKETDGLYEIRVRLAGNIFRIIGCFDEGRLVVLFNGFQKKSRKTPREELNRAARIRADYFDEKRTRKNK